MSSSLSVRNYKIRLLTSINTYEAVKALHIYEVCLFPIRDLVQLWWISAPLIIYRPHTDKLALYYVIE